MAIVPATVIATARDILQDTVADYRYSDDSLLRGLNEALRDARRLRPDIYLSDGIFTPVPTVTSATMNDALLIDEQFESAFVFYVVGFAELRDDQYSQDGRGAALLTQFKTVLVGA